MKTTAEQWSTQTTEGRKAAGYPHPSTQAWVSIRDIRNPTSESSSARPFSTM